MRSALAPTLSQSESTLLSVSDEILLNITSRLGLVDSACIALTCKKTAAFYSTPRKTKTEKATKSKIRPPSRKLLATLRLQSGDEERRLESLEDCEGFSDEFEWEDHLETMEERFGNRLDGNVLAEFHRRLDEGWNNSTGRFCHSCSKFVSTTEAFWEKKKQYWLYLDAGKTGTNFRRVADCEEREGDEDVVVQGWIKHGKGEVELKSGERFQESRYAGFMYLKCPTCTVSAECAEWCECYDDCFDGCTCPLVRV